MLYIHSRNETGHRALPCSRTLFGVLVDRPRTSSQNPFQYPRELDSLQATLGGLSQAAFYAVGALLVALGGGAGYVAGSQAPGTMMTAFRACIAIPRA